EVLDQLAKLLVEVDHRVRRGAQHGVAEKADRLDGHGHPFVAQTNNAVQSTDPMIGRSDRARGSADTHESTLIDIPAWAWLGCPSCSQPRSSFDISDGAPAPSRNRH